MREILFRGKRISNGEWVEGWLTAVCENDGLCIVQNFTVYPIDTETVGQYTGLTDKNGKKIFEGDIVKGAWDTIIQVYCDDSYLRFRAKDKDEYCQDIDYYGLDMLEIIGNIHDNPELLKEGADND